MGPGQGVGGGLKSRTPSKMAFSVVWFLEVEILTTTYQKVLILGSLIPCRVGFHSMASDSWVNAKGGVGLEFKI